MNPNRVSALSKDDQITKIMFSVKDVLVRIEFIDRDRRGVLTIGNKKYVIVPSDYELAQYVEEDQTFDGIHLGKKSNAVTEREIEKKIVMLDEDGSYHLGKSTIVAKKNGVQVGDAFAKEGETVVINGRKATVKIVDKLY